MPRRRKAQTIEPGIRYWKDGYQAYVRVDGVLRSQGFDISTDLATMRAWRTTQTGRYGTATDPAGSFSALVETYKTRITAMPTYAQRAAHMDLWVQALGRDRAPFSITSVEIDVIMQRWLVTPSTPEPHKRHGGRPSGPHGIDPQTVRKRRYALQAFFATMFPGKDHPVKHARNFPPPEPEARDLGYARIARILAAMPTYRSTKRGAVAHLSLSKLRAAVLAATGMPPGMLGEVQPYDFSPGARTIRFDRRTKGEGVEARTLPLTDDGLAAFQAFHAANAYGRFSVEALNQSFKRAAKAAGVDPRTVTIYDLRHSFGCLLYRVTRDLATVGRFLMHAEGSPMTARYAKAANQDVDREAAAKVSAALLSARREELRTVPAHVPGKVPKLSRKVVPAGKSLKDSRLRDVV